MVGRAIKLHPVGDKALQRICKVGAGGIEDCHVIEARGARRRRAAAFALPGVEADVVVIAASRNECRLAAEHLLQLETQHAAVEIQGALKVRDLEMHMPNAGTGWKGWVTGHDQIFL